MRALSEASERLGMSQLSLIRSAISAYLQPMGLGPEERPRRFYKEAEAPHGKGTRPEQGTCD